MTKSFTANKLIGRTSPTHGTGMRMITGAITLDPTREAIHCSDVGLKTIQSVHMLNNSFATCAFPFVSTPGTYDNLASLVVYDRRFATYVAKSGTLTFRVLVAGE